jgi:6-phosphogluconolactonase
LSEAGALVVTADASTLADAVAEHVRLCARESIAARGRFDVALAGGSTPKAAYELLAASAAHEAFAWEHVRFFFGDERCVGPEDDQSNYKMAANALLRPLGIKASSIFRMHGEDEPGRAAQAYAGVLRRELAAAHGTPLFDLVMLGMGPDGHTASLFPGTDPYADDAELVRAPFVAKFDTYRLTLTPRVLTSARSVAVAAAGESKAAALAAARRPSADAELYPIAVLRDAADKLTWFVDRDAASQL